MTVRPRCLTCFRWAVSGRESTFVWFFALFVFLIGIWHQPFVNFETRFAVFAQEMLRNGPSLFPTTYGQPYPDYPATSTLLIWLFSLPFGEVTKFSAILPTALASATIVLMTYRLYRLHSRDWAVFAAGFELLTLTFLSESRSISLDQMVSAVAITAFYLTHQADIDVRPLPTRTLFALLCLGFLIRGPIGLVIPASAVFSHLIWTRKPKVAIAFTLASACALFFCLAIITSLAYFVYGADFVSDMLRMQVVGRFSEVTRTPWSYYFVSSFQNFALSYPLAIATLIGIAVDKSGLVSTEFACDTTVKNCLQADRKDAQQLTTGVSRQNTIHECGTHGVTQATAGLTRFKTSQDALRLVFILATWVCFILIGLSIPETKKSRYILSIVPALAGIASYAFIATPTKVIMWLRRGIVFVLCLVPVASTVFLLAAKKQLAIYGMTSYFPAIFTAFLCFLLFFLLFCSRASTIRQSIFAMAIAVTSIVYDYIAVAEPIDIRLHDTSGFVRRIEFLSDRRPGEVVFYKENPDGLAIKYLVNASITKGFPRFVTGPDDLRKIHSPFWLLTSVRNIEELERSGISTLDIAYRGKLGGSEYLAIFVDPTSH